MDGCEQHPTDRFPAASFVMTDADARSFLQWADRERTINKLVQLGKLGFGEFLLRRQLSYDMLVHETAGGTPHLA